MAKSGNGSDDESEEFQSSNSSLDLKKSNAPIIPRIQTVNHHRALDAPESGEISLPFDIEFAPVLDKLDLGADTSLGFDFQRPENNDPATIFSYNLSSIRQDHVNFDNIDGDKNDSELKDGTHVLGQPSPQESEEYQSNGSSINFGNNSKFRELTPRLKNDSVEDLDFLNSNLIEARHQTHMPGQSSPQESEEFQSNGSSINFGNNSKFRELTPRLKNDSVEDLDFLNSNLIEETFSGQESEEFSSNNSTIDIIPNTIIQSHAPRITSVLETGNISKEFEDMLNLNSETNHVFEKGFLTTIPSQNTDSPQESDELNSSSSSIRHYSLNSKPVVPRNVQFEPLNQNESIATNEEDLDLGEEMIRIKSFEKLKSENSSPAESEEFKSSNSSVDLVLTKDKAVFMARKSMEIISKDEILSDKNAYALEANENALNMIPKDRVNGKEDTTISTQPIVQSLEPKSKHLDKSKNLRPRNSAAIDPPARLSMLGPPSESSSVESTSEDEPENLLNVEDRREPPINGNFHGKYYRFFVPRPVNKPKISSPTDDVACYFGLYDQKCYFSGFIFKRNELGTNGNLLNKSHTLRQYGTVECGGEWIKYWAEILGGLLLLWRVPSELQEHIYPKNPKVIGKNFKNPPEKGIAALIQGEIFPSLECIESIKLKSTPFILQLTNSLAELKTSPFSSLYADDIPSPPLPFTSLFTLSNQGLNKYTFAAPAFITSSLWVRAIQLSIFENNQINFIFSMKLLKEPRYLNVWTDLSIPPFSLGLKGNSKPFECLVDARHGIEMESKRYYCLVSHEKTDHLQVKEDNKASNRKSTLFGHVQTETISDSAKYSEPITEEFKGNIWLYEDEADRDRRQSPLVKIENVHSAFLIWPRSKIPSENEFFTSIKLYGNISYFSKTEGKKKKDRKSRMTWHEVEKSPEKFNEKILNAVSRNGSSFFTLSFENTQLSLRFLVSIWNTFGIETALESCYEKENLWNNPPVGWGNLSLKVDELFGDFDLSDIRNSQESFDRMLHDKLKILKMGLSVEWLTSVNGLIEFHDRFEKEEILIKAEALIKSAYDLPKDCVIPLWLEDEMNSRGINFQDRKSGSQFTESPNQPYMVGAKIEENSNIKIPPPRDNSLLVNFDERNVQLMEADTLVKSVEENQKLPGKRQHGSFLTKNDSELALEREFSSSSSSADTSSSEEIIPKESDKPYILDLTITIPNNLSIDTQSVISSWTEEEYIRFQSYVAWINKECQNHNINGGMDVLDPDRLIFESKSLLGTGFNQRPKKETIHGPLISAIPKNNSSIQNMKNAPLNEGLVGNNSRSSLIIPAGSKDLPGNLISAIPKNNSAILDLKNTPFTEGLVGNNSRSSLILSGGFKERMSGAGRLRSSTLLAADKNDTTISLTPVGQDPNEIIFPDGLLAQKKQPINHTASNGPLISAIPKNKTEVQPVNDLDQGLIGQMRSRESFIQNSKTPPKPKNVNPRQSYMNPIPGTFEPTTNQGLYGYPAPFFGPNTPYSSPIQNSNFAAIPTPESAVSSQSYTNPAYFNQTINAQAVMYSTPLTFLPMDYQQALFYQQYMYSLESQKKSKHKKGKKNKKKKKKKESLVITNTKLVPLQPISNQNHLFYHQEHMAPKPAETIIKPRLESSSEESDGSDEEKLWHISQQSINRESIESDVRNFNTADIKQHYEDRDKNGEYAVESSSEESVES